MLKLIVSVLLLILLISNTIGQNNNEQFQATIYKHYLANEIVLWDRAIATKEKTTTYDDEESLFQLVNAYYGLISSNIKNGKEDLAEEQLERAEAHLNQLLILTPNNQQYKAYQAAYIAFEMEFNPWKIMTLGSQSKAILMEAKKDGENIAEVCHEWANMKYFAPSFAGGDKEEGMHYYKKAYLIFENTKDTQHWYYLHIKMRYADALAEQNKKNEAKQIYQELLATKPQFKLAKKKLEACN